MVPSPRKRGENSVVFEFFPLLRGKWPPTEEAVEGGGGRACRSEPYESRRSVSPFSPGTLAVSDRAGVSYLRRRHQPTARPTRNAHTTAVGAGIGSRGGSCSPPLASRTDGWRMSPCWR